MNKQKIKKISIELAIYVVVFTLIAWGAPIVLSKILKTEYPIAAITSSSMWPNLKKGDIILIKGVEKEEIEIGDIIIFENEAGMNRPGFTVHRVVKKNEDNIITKGDANNIEDSPVEYDKIVGRALEVKGKVFRIPYFGRISQLVNNS